MSRHLCVSVRRFSVLVWINGINMLNVNVFKAHVV